MRRPVLLPLLLALLLPLTTACSDGGGDGGGGGGAPDALPAPDGPRVTVRAGDVEVLAEVADDDDERAVGLMGRTSVPPGTGMVFLYDAPVDGQFYMYRVPVPLTATFAREGRVVGVVEMAPCPDQDPSDCPRYGPGEAFDTVLETAPEEVAGRVEVGDPLVVQR